MSVCLLIRDEEGAAERLVPVATQQTFVAKWLPGAAALGLEWVDLMETGFDVTRENQRAVIEELERLRAWMMERDEAHEIGRLERLLAELRALQFEPGATAFVG